MEFAAFKFYKNNLMIIILSGFLVFEQLFYGLFISSNASRLQKVYFLSAAAMFIFLLISTFLHLKKPGKIRIFHEFYELSFGFFGMGVALLRFLYVEFNADLFRIPTVYIAVIYGVAVIYVFHYRQSIFIYSALSAAAVCFMPVVHPEIRVSSYFADICSNGIIALMISIINYRNFINNFINKKLIEEKNNDLIKKNRQIEYINMELKEQSERDELTGLFNRRYLNRVIRSVSKKAERYKLDFAIIIMDIDHFKNINDTYGHDIGDIVLIEIARILSENIRDVDICGRWGGEEFFIICPETNLDNSYLFADRLRKLINAYHFSSNQHVSASFGIASFKEYPEVTSLMKAADSRLYEAKKKGRNMAVAG